MAKTSAITVILVSAALPLVAQKVRAPKHFFRDAPLRTAAPTGADATTPLPLENGADPLVRQKHL